MGVSTHDSHNAAGSTLDGWVSTPLRCATRYHYGCPLLPHGHPQLRWCPRPTTIGVPAPDLYGCPPLTLPPASPTQQTLWVSPPTNVPADKCCTPFPHLFAGVPAPICGCPPRPICGCPPRPRPFVIPASIYGCPPRPFMGVHLDPVFMGVHLDPVHLDPAEWLLHPGCPSVGDPGVPVLATPRPLAKNQQMPWNLSDDQVPAAPSAAVGVSPTVAGRLRQP